MAIPWREVRTPLWGTALQAGAGSAPPAPPCAPRALPPARSPRGPRAEGPGRAGSAPSASPHTWTLRSSETSTRGAMPAGKRRPSFLLLPPRAKASTEAGRTRGSAQSRGGPARRAGGRGAQPCNDHLSQCQAFCLKRIDQRSKQLSHRLILAAFGN